jgi:hypothetical protein
MREDRNEKVDIELDELMAHYLKTEKMHEEVGNKITKYQKRLDSLQSENTELHELLKIKKAERDKAIVELAQETKSQPEFDSIKNDIRDISERISEISEMCSFIEKELHVAMTSGINKAGQAVYAARFNVINLYIKREAQEIKKTVDLKIAELWALRCMTPVSGDYSAFLRDILPPFTLAEHNILQQKMITKVFSTKKEVDRG